MHTVPLPRHQLERDAASHLVETVGAQTHRIALRPLHQQSAFHTDFRLVVEIDRCAGRDAQRGALVDHKTVHHAVWTVGGQSRVLAYRPVAHGHRILSGRTQRDRLQHTVGHKVEIAVDVKRSVGRGLVDTCRDKHIKAVVAAHLNVGKPLSGTPVDIHIEMRAVAHPVNRDVADAQLFLVAVVDKKTMRGCGLSSKYGVETERVGRKHQRVAAACREVVLDARR